MGLSSMVAHLLARIKNDNHKFYSLVTNIHMSAQLILLFDLVGEAQRES
jgi:hypothetical protein